MTSGYKVHRLWWIFKRGKFIVAYLPEDLSCIHRPWEWLSEEEEFSWYLSAWLLARKINLNRTKKIAFVIEIY